MDLAETVDDLICIFDGTGDTTMDTLAMFVFGWLLAALFVLWLGRLLYSRFIAKAIDKTLDAAEGTKAEAATAPTTPSADVGDGGLRRSVSAGSTAAAARPAARGQAASTPTARRRLLTRQSPAPELKKKTKFVAAPQTTGADNVSVLWVNDVFQWIYNDLEVVNELALVWLQSLNEYCKKSVVEEGVGLEFVRILPETNPPQINNSFSECASNDDVTITCDCEATPAFQIKCFRQKGDKMEISHYRANVNRFRARLNIFSVSEKLQATVKCDGWPDIKIGLAQVGNIKNNLDETHLQELIIEIAANALRHTEVNLNLAAFPNCPRLIRHIDTPGRFQHNYDAQINHIPRTEADKRLLVKVVKASQLGANDGCKEPYCVVEMDEPPQKNQTAVQKNTDSPSWDEHFLFDITPHTAEILFEVYDHSRSPHRFLGLGIVGVEELLINPSQRQIISLQSRPYESDQVSGTLTVEFMFIEGATVPTLTPTDHPYKIKETIPPMSLSNPRIPPSASYNEKLVNGDHLTPLGNRQDGIGDKLVIQSVQRQPSQRLVKVELSGGAWKEIERVERSLDEDEATEKIEKETIAAMAATNGTVNNAADPEKAFGESTALENGDNKPSTENLVSVSATNTLQQGMSPEQNPEYRGRTRKRRDFFGTIKRRLGRSKGRSKSAGPDNQEDGRDDSLNRSISADRSRGEDGYRLGLPGMENSRRSSLSEASGLSSASTRTYINEASTLVLETIENGIKKHYLVPLSLAQKSKWRKKGNKLHIFNDHTFVAKHLQGGTVCQVCAKSIARRLGKQGYECRDCLLKCHKHCHVRVNDNCPTSTIHNIELSYIQNPYTDKNLRML